jgi:hypothetical protein
MTRGAIVVAAITANLARRGRAEKKTKSCLRDVVPVGVSVRGTAIIVRREHGVD